jgi:peptidoglycan hydrolase-like protein with peptidoglycan-binding domain
MLRATRTVLVLALLPLAGSPASAQAPPAAADAALAAQKAAFLALPEATRKAAQDALVWLGFYNGVSDGDFGKRTRDAILAFQASVKAPAGGALSAPELEALLAAAEKAREAAGFKVVSDPKSGARIGAPLKLISARAGVRLDFASSAGLDLGALYARLSAATAARRVVYKAIKPDAFFVVSGQDGATMFYTRFDKSETASPPIRGFTFAYPAAQAAQLNRVALAVANSFEPFPAAPATPAASAGASAAATAEPGSGAPAAVPEPAATALIIAPGKALTALRADDCPNPTVAGKPARIERVDPATGLALLAGEFASSPETPRFGAPARDLVVLGFAGERVAASAASLTGGEARPAVIAAVEKSASGGPAFDRHGALAGLMAPIGGEPRRVAGVALAAPHALIAPEAIRAFLGGGEPAPASAATLSAGDLAARERHALVAVFCPK